MHTSHINIFLLYILNHYKDIKECHRYVSIIKFSGQTLIDII